MRIHDARAVLVVVLTALISGTAPARSLAEGRAGQGGRDSLYAACFQAANDHLGKFEFQQSFDACKEALTYKPEDFLVRAMMCLDLYEIAEAMDNTQPGVKDKKLQIYAQMVSIAEEGIHAAPEKGECYFMRGLANARISTTKGVFSQLSLASQIEHDWLLAVDRRSDYTTPNGENLQASSCVALGVYYRLAPRFFLLKWLFGIEGDLDKSVAYCQRAYQLDSTRIEIVKEYGVALITHGLDHDDTAEIERGKSYLRKVAMLPDRLHTDEIDKRHALMLLSNISLCPGYSRDEEQDISEKAASSRVNE